jgi:hypothetical protein
MGLALLAFVWLPDGRNFGEAMIADGFAHEYTCDRPYAYVDAFEQSSRSPTRRDGGHLPHARGIRRSQPTGLLSLRLPLRPSPRSVP